MARLNIVACLATAILALNTLTSALPTSPDTITIHDYPHFYSFDSSQDTCGDRSFAKVPVKNATANCCATLQSDIKKKYGQWVIGGFEPGNDAWMTIASSGSCSLSFQPATMEGLEAGTTWAIGEADAYQLVTDTVEMAFENGEGAAEGILPCVGPKKKLWDLYWRVWDARED